MKVAVCKKSFGIKFVQILKSKFTIVQLYRKMKIQKAKCFILDFQYFDTIADMINRELLAGGNVLVHCVMGVSRSTTLILAFLVKYRKLTLSQSYYHVFERRKCVNPNCGFWRQLINYELKIMQVKYERVRNKI